MCSVNIEQNRSILFTFYSILILTHQQQTAFENIVEKEEIARYEQFLLFPQSFLLNQIVVPPFVHVLDFIFLFAAELKEPYWHMRESVNIIVH